MLIRVTSAVLVCGLLSACATTGEPKSQTDTENFVAVSLKQYGVFSQRRVEQAAPNPSL